MKESTREIQDLVDWKNIKGASDMSACQRNLVVSKLIEEEDPNQLVETLLNSVKPDSINKLISRLYRTESDYEIIMVTKEIKKAAQVVLDNYYDDQINDEISDYRYEMHICNLENAGMLTQGGI